MTAAITPFPTRSPLPFDPALPATERHGMLLSALPPALRSVLEAGSVECRPRFSEERFDGMTERWFPPAMVTPQDAAMARRALDDMAETVLAPVAPNHLLARILALLSHYPAKSMAPDVEQLIALDWASDLGEYPAWAIDAAVRTWRRTKKWRPSIAEMRAICEEMCAQERALADRLRAVVKAGEGERQDTRPTGQVRAMAAKSIRGMW